MRENGFHYSELPFNKNPVKLYGYYQSHKYFNENYNYIVNEIGLDTFKDEILNTYKYYFNTNTINISIHFRLGDYKKCQFHHPIMPVTYYINSIKHIINKINNDSFNILYFCEKEDNKDVISSINVLKDNFPKITFTKVDDVIDDWKQMLIMSICNHNIIANSSFSWWGAYFNTNKNKIVCYPNKWFGSGLKHNTDDLCPDEWNKINIS